MSILENSVEVKNAFNVIKKAMEDDCPSEKGSYAHAWHCNIAMMCYDAILAHEVSVIDDYSGQMSNDDAHIVANDAASRFMKICFDVKTDA